MQLHSHQSDASAYSFHLPPLNLYLCGILSWRGSNQGSQVFLSFFVSQSPVQQALHLTAAAGCQRLSYQLYLKFLLWTEGEVRRDALLPAQSMSRWEALLGGPPAAKMDCLVYYQNTCKNISTGCCT